MLPRLDRFARALVLSAVVAGGSACSSPPPVSDEALIAEIQQIRDAKDRAFASDGSPIPPERRDELLPLAYYPPSLEYRVPAVLRPEPVRETIEMPTSTGQIRRMQRVGRLEFTLGGQVRTLSAFVEAGSRDVSRLFVPFADLTSGTETYQAGRYLDLDRTATGLYVIDFNRAYNPFCYYDPRYDCPFPPRENRLGTHVRAGERVRENGAATRVEAVEEAANRR
ncbi:MAG TPA: DUF1684 domain-containing protein [Vicinamibacterales bacterium]|nr:DUF1684 domain-containing protein [Vicinamibacterales bacterium]